jgi:DNA-directed RNA polymerase subunit H
MGGIHMVTKKRRKTIRKDERTWSVADHLLVPKHEKVSEKEKKELLERYSCGIKDLPKIFINDPAIQDIDTKPGDVIKITRASPTAGTSCYYRTVIEGV